MIDVPYNLLSLQNQLLQTPRKKNSSQKASMGQKWFKGSPKSRSNQRMSKKLLKSSPVEKTPSEPVIPPQVVEFDLGGTPERLSVFDPIHILEHDADDVLKASSGTLCSFDIKQETPSFQSPSPLITVDGSKGKKGKGGKARVKSSGKQKNGKTPNTKTPDIDGRKKSWACMAKLPEASYRIIADYVEIEAPPKPNAYIRYMERPHEELADEVEYDLDEEDCAWLDLVNEKRKEQNFLPVKFEDMELLMDRLEKESYFQMQSTGIDQGALIDDDAVCCICMDGECQNSNAILFCDMCNLAVHQECYGVPYIPEGQWLCRRCLQSPSRAVDCALCPNKGGAFKQTDDGRWAHVVCAIWIPEVCFANTVFLEPVDSINNIPPARWRLVCYICKQKGVGACIQCHKGNCYTAFHVTCAQQAGLCMKMDTVRESSSITVKKTAFCDHHAPPESDFFKDGDGDGTPSPRQKMRQTRKLLAEKRSAIPVLSIPTIPHDRIAEITSMVNFSRKNQFIKRLMAYWKLKRQLRNGVPLLRRLQAASSVPHPATRDTPGQPINPSQMAENQEHYRYWLRLRQDLERARLLCELVRKREKVKRELIHLKSREVEIKLKPFSLLLLNVLDEIESKDVQQIFANPVDISEVPDYLDVVEKPMDFSTIREKINSFEYNNIEEFEADFNLMIDNCLNYNSKDTVFYRTAVRLREIGGIIIRYARRSISSIGFDPGTGLHLPERTFVPVVLTDEEILQKVENLLNDEKRFEMPFNKHLDLLYEVLDDTLALSHSATRKKKFTRVKQEIIRVRRVKHSKNSQLNKLSSKSPIKKKYNRTRSHSDTRDDDDESSPEPEVSTGTKLRGRPKKISSEKQSRVQSTSEQNTKRTLRPVKRKSSDTFNENSRWSASKLTSSNTNNNSQPPAKKSRRISSSASTSTTTSLTATGMSTPLKPRTSQASASPEWKKTLSFSPDSTSSSTLRDRDTIRLRDRDQHTEKPPNQKSPSKSTPAQPAGVSRRSAILFTKKGTSTPTKNPHSSPNKNRASSHKADSISSNKSPNLSSQSQSKPNNVKPVPNKKLVGRKPLSRASHKEAPQVEQEVRKGRNPPRRNSTRTNATTVNYSATTNNNVMNDNNSHRAINSLPSNINSLNRGTEPVSSNWINSSPTSKSYSGKADQLMNTNLISSNTNSTSTSCNSRRKKKGSKNNTSATLNSNVTNNNNNITNFVGENNISGNANVGSSGNGSSNFNFQPLGRMSILSSNNNNSKNNKGDNTKSDSFMVYRSGGRDMDSNSEDEKNGNEEEESKVRGGSDDSDVNDDDDDQESSSDGSSSGCSKNSTSKSSSSESEASEDGGSDSDGRVDTRLNSHQTRNDHNNSGSAVNRKKINNQGGQCRDPINQNSNIAVDDDEEEEEEGLVKDDVNILKIRLQPLDLVWAKCKEGFWYPALIVNPDMPHGFTQNQVHIPGPPSDIIVKRPRTTNDEACFLVLCFDAKRTWEWIPRRNLQPLGQNPRIDQGHLDTVRKTDRRSSDKRALRRAYEKAILHRRRVTAVINDETCKFHMVENMSGSQEFPVPASDDCNNNNLQEEFSLVIDDVQQESQVSKYLLRTTKLLNPEKYKMPGFSLNQISQQARIMDSVPSPDSRETSSVEQLNESRRLNPRVGRLNCYKNMKKNCKCCE